MQAIGAAIGADRFGGMVFVVEVEKNEMQFPLFGDVRKLVTHWFTIEDAVSAFETSADRIYSGLTMVFGGIEFRPSN